MNTFFLLVENSLSWVVILLAVFVIVLIVIVFYVLAKTRGLERKSAILFEGKDGKSLEELMLKNSTDIKSLDIEIQELYNISNKIHQLSFSSIHKVGIIRFNPFGDIGGDQSFSVALLDGKNTGVVISSLHTKEGTRVYSKPIAKGEEEKYPLTEEEKKVVKIAMQKKPSKV
ncbi:MAG: DUF4446 family protein [Parcubacteria group bacterium]